MASLAVVVAVRGSCRGFAAIPISSARVLAVTGLRGISAVTPIHFGFGPTGVAYPAIVTAIVSITATFFDWLMAMRAFARCEAALVWPSAFCCSRASRRWYPGYAR